MNHQRFRKHAPSAGRGRVGAFKRLLGAGALAAAAVAALSACDVTQINWSNHFYVVSSACAVPPLTPGATTLKNGVGYIGIPGAPGTTFVRLSQTHFGDITRDGVQDVAVSLECYGQVGTESIIGTEIQVFTRDGVPVQRLVPPKKYPGASIPAFFPNNDTWIYDRTLYTGVESYPPATDQAPASEYDIYRWDWNGHAFTPVIVSAQVNIAGAVLTLPPTWVAEAVAPPAHSHLIMPTWCLMPHSATPPPSIDAPGCTIAFSAVPTGAATPQLSVDTPGGLVSNPEYCDPARPQTVSLLSHQDSTLGTRPADYRNWLYSCADGTRWPVEQYVADNSPGYVLYSSHATAAVHAVLTNVAKTAKLPAINAPLRLSDLGIIRSVTATAGGHHITLDRVVRGPNGLINDSPQTFAYDVPDAALQNGQTLQVGDVIQLNTNGTTVTHVQPGN